MLTGADVGVGIVDRYKALLQFFTEHASMFPEECKWYARRLNKITALA
jgi:hypothetical protein